MQQMEKNEILKMSEESASMNRTLQNSRSGPAVISPSAATRNQEAASPHRWPSGPMKKAGCGREPRRDSAQTCGQKCSRVGFSNYVILKMFGF